MLKMSQVQYVSESGQDVLLADLTALLSDTPCAYSDVRRNSKIRAQHIYLDSFRNQGQPYVWFRVGISSSYSKNMDITLTMTPICMILKTWDFLTIC